ncbi:MULTISPECIES: glutathione S-transferase family protein [unclassified Methylobacterium]|uniref:glutathione S-transferase family protein n=1 Tax=unclassified Methylobacterium TaxID=2615210 RepID=UPI0006F79416|nr:MULTISPECIES: glutathione S-transferase family protein [unclassified Methylobacterium]KQO57846.1 glutathione S-transferase [Methylobacterium sp. Leaf86]KQO85705.1 glutathione S-transferase [Methylobacterium sp. Leaf91]
MILYGTSYSPFVRKILVTLAEKNITFEHVPVFFHAPDEAFQACSPLGKIPAFEDDGFRLADSSAISAYIEAKYPSPVLWPQAPKERARAVWFDKFGDTELFAVLIKPFAERVVKPVLMGKPGDEAVAVKAVTDEFPKLYDYLESQIDGPYLVGDAFSIADISVATTFHNLRLAKEPVDAGRWPKLAAYIDATLSRPSFVTAIAARTK